MHRVLLLCAALIIGGCATGYQPRNITGGFSEVQIRGDVWEVIFSGNGYATRETVQTFWLYRCAELTLMKGYDGFEVLSDMNLASQPDATADAMLVPVQAPLVDKPYLVGRIRMLKGPIKQKPPHIFDAANLKSRLEPLVKGKLCDGNVCPHFHGYLLPDV